MAEAGKRAVLRAGVGFFGFAAGRSVHIVDRHGLTDPLLARLPIINAKRWRVGHYNRLTPPGYLEGLQDGVNGISHPNLAVYYDRLRTVISGDLFSLERISEIVRFNLGENDHLKTSYVQDSWVTLPLPRVTVPVKEGTPWNAKACRVLNDMGISILLNGRCHFSSLEVSLDGNDHYSLQFYLENKRLAVCHVDPDASHGTGLRTDTVTVPDSAARHGYDRVVVQPFGGDGLYSFGHLRLLSSELQSEPGMVVAHDQIDKVRPEGTFWRCDECIILTRGGLAITVDEDCIADTIELSLDANDRYKLTFMSNRMELAEVTIGDSESAVSGLQVYRVPVPETVRAGGFDEIVIRPIDGDGGYSLGHLRLIAESTL